MFLNLYQDKSKGILTEQRFISEIRECATITKLDEAILNRLIDRITVGEVQTVDDEKIQQMKIKYNFIRESPNGIETRESE